MIKVGNGRQVDVIETLSYSTLKYPDGSQQTVWLPDATVPYLSGKHAISFVVAILILIAGTSYTSLLISWQWLLRCNKICTCLSNLTMFLTIAGIATGLVYSYWYVSFYTLYQL